MTRKGGTMKMKAWHGVALVALSTMAACVPQGDSEGGDAVVAEGAVTPPDAVLEAVWSVDGERLAATWERGGRTVLVGLWGPADETAPAPSSGIPLAEGEAGWATWAPNGLWVAYAAGRPAARDVVRARPDGMGAEPLTQDPADDYDPAYSPDGRRLAFVSTRGGGGPRLFVMDADGGDARLVGDLGGAVRRPMWAPDGRRLAVEVAEEGGAAIYVVNADGTGWGRLGTGHLPAWNQDGAGVTYTENDSLFWRPAMGGARRFLVARARVGRPSPDGRWMAFVRDDSTGAALYLADLTTGAETRITPP